jgi:hypothetical protein
MDKPLRVSIEHRWMSNTDPDKSLTVGNKYMRGFTIRHYGTEIACKYPDKKDPSKGVVVFNNHTYSSRTSKFQCRIRHAIPNTWTTISVSSDRFHRGDDYVSSLRNVKAALVVIYGDQEELVKELKETRLKSTRANLWYKITHLQEETEKVAKFLKRKPKGLKRFKLDVIALAVEADSYHEARQAKRNARWEKRDEEYKRQREARDAELRLTQAERIAKWRAGERVYASMQNEPTMVRFSNGGKRVQTSRGVEILLCDALRLFKVAKLAHDMDLPEVSAFIDDVNNRHLSIGSYTLNNLSPTGDVTVGCHYITYGEMEQLFNQLPEECKKEIQD